MSGIVETTWGGGVTIVPSDTTTGAADQNFKALYIGGGGNVAVVMESGAVLTFTAPPVGTVLPVRGKRVNATNTTATLMVGLQ